MPLVRKHGEVCVLLMLHLVAEGQSSRGVLFCKAYPWTRLNQLVLFMDSSFAGHSMGPYSRRSLMDLMESYPDLHKWSVPVINPADIQICRRPDGSPYELGRGGFCKVRLHQTPSTLLPFELSLNREQLWKRRTQQRRLLQGARHIDFHSFLLSVETVHSCQTLLEMAPGGAW